MKVPLIKTSLPGPKASELIRVDEGFISPSYTRIYPLVVEKARGLWVQDVDESVPGFHSGYSRELDRALPSRSR